MGTICIFIRFAEKTMKTLHPATRFIQKRLKIL
jgi:hypothetical protein